MGIVDLVQLQSKYKLYVNKILNFTINRLRGFIKKTKRKYIYRNNFDQTFYRKAHLKI